MFWCEPTDSESLEVSAPSKYERLAVQGFCSSSTSSGHGYEETRKGKRKGSKAKRWTTNVKDLKRREKNEKERQRVKEISLQYYRLRAAIDDPNPEKKLKKILVLDAAVNYIADLKKENNDLKTYIEELKSKLNQESSADSSTQDCELEVEIPEGHDDLKCQETVLEHSPPLKDRVVASSSMISPSSSLSLTSPLSPSSMSLVHWPSYFTGSGQPFIVMSPPGDTIEIKDQCYIRDTRQQTVPPRLHHPVCPHLH